MGTFSTISSLSAYVRANLKEVLVTDMAEYNSTTLRDNKQKYVYDAYTPSQYDRTEEFLNSNTSVLDNARSSMNMFILATYTDTSSVAMPSGHPSWADGSPQNESVPFFMEYGNGASPLYQYTARPYFMNTYADIEKNLKKNLISGLKKRGIGAY